MSMRRQLYEWQINRQTNGYPLASVTDGTTFETIAGIPISIFTGGIGNNITMPAATTATQFIAIDNMRCSPSWFLSGAAVMAVFNVGAEGLVDLTSFGSTYEDATTNLSAGFTINTSASVPYTTLPVPDTNSGAGGGATFQIIAVGTASPNTTASVRVSGGTGYAVGDILTWLNATVVATAANISGATGTALAVEVVAGDLGGFVDQTEIPFTGTQPSPIYSPSTANPELAFQTTHVNPFTSIAGPMMFMQLLINTTSYFNETDGTVGPGLPGTASPCPEMASCRSTFEFESPVYILPGQQWDVQVTVYNDSRSTIGDSTRTYNFTNSDPSIGITNPEDLCCLVQYTLYDGPDALIASKLVEMGVAVRPENVDWYKRQLLEGTI